jgi:glycerol uptake facilitator-like aquaporin
MNKLSQCIAEAVGTFALIFIGIGAINANPGLLGVALAHGLTIAVMVSATGHISGGHLNPAVTLGALVGGKIDLGGALRYWVSQLAGATLAAFVCLGLFNRAIVIAGTPSLLRTALHGKVAYAPTFAPLLATRRLRRSGRDSCPMIPRRYGRLPITWPQPTP